MIPENLHIEKVHQEGSLVFLDSYQASNIWGIPRETQFWMKKIGEKTFLVSLEKRQDNENFQF